MKVEILKKKFKKFKISEALIINEFDDFDYKPHYMISKKRLKKFKIEDKKQFTGEESTSIWMRKFLGLGGRL